MLGCMGGGAQGAGENQKKARSPCLGWGLGRDKHAPVLTLAWKGPHAWRRRAESDLNCHLQPHRNLLPHHCREQKQVAARHQLGDTERLLATP